MDHAYHDSPTLWKNMLLAGLEEDGWPWDWTTFGAERVGRRAGGGRKDRALRARIVAKSEGVWASDGLAKAAEQVAAELGEALTVTLKIRNGERFGKGAVLCQWSGTARAVLALERPFLNLAAYASGIATTTGRFVETVTTHCPRHTPRVTSTRKTLPGYRDIAVHAVLCGGGFSHRVSLAGGVLIKENHIAAAGGIAPAVAGARARAPHGLKIEVEVTSLKELAEAVRAGADAVLLDNFTPVQVAQALKQLDEAAAGSRPVVEVSGGLTLETIGAYAQPGVSILSVGSLTHSIRASDFSLLVE